ncbi:MAG: GNAT family N-acetyltransferase [Lachnospiraceae bacterium]|nr:GNAT family N-acetyltransferase [Lachnospiraceae bacterium]
MDNGKADLKSQISYEWATPDDWTQAMSLVWTTFMEFEAADYGPEGVGHFFEFITDDDLHSAFLKGNYPMVVARLEGRIIGVGSLRGGNRLSLLFVHKDYHRLGIATQILDKLCIYLRDVVHENSMIVRAAPYAVGFYEKNGFVALEPERNISGIRVTTMELIF